MLELKTEYNGYTIKWLDFRRCFEISKDGTNVKDVKDLEEAEKWVNQRNKKKWKRINVLYQDGYQRTSDFAPGEATSIIDDESAWVTRSDASRKKINLRNIFTDTPENKNRIAEIVSLSSEIAAKKKTIQSVHDTLETITPEMMEL